MDIRTIQLSQLTGIKDIAAKYSQLGEEYILSRLKFDNSNAEKEATHAHAPVRINGFTMVVCLSGSFTLGINLDNIEVESNTVIMAGPNSILRFNKGKDDEVDAYTLFVSIEFLKDINLDINALSSTHFSEKPSPALCLTNEETSHLKRYLDLIHLNATANTTQVYVRNIARCLMASMLYQLMQYAENHKMFDVQQEEHQPQSRRMNYVRDFISLVQKHHNRERSVGFYAGKLFISPKYLSLIIKEQTGRSAAEWIDEYVILEAKNLLRFSGKNIQQIAYELNFSNQSSFGKYFKHLTGLSPSEFQKS